MCKIEAPSIRSLIVMLVMACCYTQANSAPTAEEVKAVSSKVADWQIATFDEHGNYRALPAKRTKSYQHRKNYGDLEWEMAALYAGMNEFRKIAEPSEKYTHWLKMIGERNNWELCETHNPYHADDHAVGMTWLALYEEFQDPDMLMPVRERFDMILDKPKTGSIEWKKDSDRFGRWGWCDALFMAPPVWTRLAKNTGESKYLEFMDQEYQFTYNLLWDTTEHFFYRDTRYFIQHEGNGKPIFWSRGNGWVFGGLALMIPDLPQHWEGRAFYIDLFKQMAGSVRKAQRPDGTWSMGLLGDVESYPIIETTGTSFFTYGLAWGVNNGLLDRSAYEPVIMKAWQALEGAVSSEGMLVYVQPVGGEPGESIKDKTEVYAIGAFLAAGAEVYKFLAEPRGDSVNTEKALSVALPDTISPRTFARFVPERKDDFAWENDKIAFRAYGPGARSGSENSGFDCWLKRVDYSIINKWYQQNAEGISYHKDHGEGLDNYKVGASAGCGGTGLWIDGKREPLETFTDYEIVEVTPERSQFKLTYERDIAGVMYREVKTNTIEMGTRLFQVDSIFFKNGQPAAALPICIGLTTQNGGAEPFSNQDQGWIATWGAHGKSELGTAAVMDPDQVEGIQVVETEQAKNNHIFLITRTSTDGRLSYQAGYGWKKAGEIETKEAWEAYLNR